MFFFYPGYPCFNMIISLNYHKLPEVPLVQHKAEVFSEVGSGLGSRQWPRRSKAAL